MKKKLVILASGNGSNAENIVDFYAENEAVEVLSIATNNEGCWCNRPRGKVRSSGIGIQQEMNLRNPSKVHRPNEKAKS